MMKDHTVHYSMNRNDWETPDALFDVLDNEFGFVLDAAASEHNHKCIWYYAEGGDLDTLSLDWQGLPSSVAAPRAIWLNPPYGREICKWTEKACSEGLKGPVPVVALVPSRTDTVWWHRDVMKASEVRLIKGRLKFELDGKAVGTAPFPSCVVVWRHNHVGPPVFSAMDRP